MERQGEHRTYQIPKEYPGGQFDMVLNSSTPVVWIMDVDSTKISVDIKLTTLSGKTYCKPSFQPHALWIVKKSWVTMEIPNWKVSCLGQTDVHFSRELIHPTWFCYAMRENSPFKENIDKWYIRLFLHIKFSVNVRAFSGFDDFLSLVSIKDGMKWQKLHIVIGK